MVIRSRRLRPKRSNFQTIKVSPSRSFSRRVRAGRFVVAPDMPSSLNIVLHPAFFNAESCRGWGSVRRC